MAKNDRIASIAAAAKKAKEAEGPVALKYKPSPGMGAKIGARTGWNPELAKGGEVRTFTPAQKADALLTEAKAARKKSAPKLVEPSGSKTPQLAPAEQFNRQAATGRAYPSRAGHTFKAGSMADMAYTGIKSPTKGVSPSGPRQRTLTPPSVGSTPTTPAIKPTPKRLPKVRVGGGKLAVVNAAINVAEAAYHESRRKKK